MASSPGTQTATQRLGKAMAILAACVFAYMGYDAMKLNERAHHHVGHEGPATGGAHHAAWVMQLAGVGILAMIGGVLSRGPVKPIKIPEAPPITGVVPEYRDFLNASSTRSQLLLGRLNAASGGRVE
jgi:hypothetical protein